MPYDSGGNFTRDYSFTADKNAGIKILSDRMDGEFDNYAGALNQVLLRDGRAGMTGVLDMGTNPIQSVGSGLVATPGIRFSTDSTSGIYMPAAGQVGLVSSGVERFRVTNTGATLTGAIVISSDGTVSGNLSVGGTTTVTGASTFTGLATLNGGIQVAGTAAFGNGAAGFNASLVGASNHPTYSLDASRSLYSDGNSTVLANGAHLAWLDSSGGWHVLGTLSITGAATISGGITGNLTGSVTGNVSGSSGSCTGTAANANTLGGVAAGSFVQNNGGTWNIGISGTAANANTVGGWSAGSIAKNDGGTYSINVTGNAATATNATNATTAANAQALNGDHAYRGSFTVGAGGDTTVTYPSAYPNGVVPMISFTSPVGGNAPYISTAALWGFIIHNPGGGVVSGVWLSLGN